MALRDCYKHGITWTPRPKPPEKVLISRMFKDYDCKFREYLPSRKWVLSTDAYWERCDSGDGISCGKVHHEEYCPEAETSESYEA